MSAAHDLTESEEAIARRVAELVLVELRAPRPRPSKSVQQRAKPSSAAIARMERKIRLKGIR